MKKRVVLNPVPKNVISVNEVNPKKMYGVYLRHCWSGMITRHPFNTGNYKVLVCEEAITRGNGVSKYEDMRIYSLDVFIANLLKDGVQVFEFDTTKELFQWLIENNQYEAMEKAKKNKE